MDKSHLIETLNKDTGLTIREAEEVVRTFFNNMANALANNERVEIRGFGSFKVKHHDGYTGKKLPLFKCGNELKEKVDTHK